MDRPPITFGNVYIGPGATGVVGVNQFGSNNDNPETELKSCVEAFYVTDPRVDRDELINFKGERTDGTCHWIRNDETYKAWLDHEHSQLLWISGSPGQGKTMLSTFLIDELESLADNATHVLFYFCSHRNEEKSTATAILRTLLHQMFKRNPTLAQHAASRMATPNRVRETLDSRSILWQILLDVLNDPSLGPVVCILDGLDECKDDNVNRLITDLRAFFGLSGRAARQTPHTFKIVILSRKIVGLHGFLRLDLESKTDDIEADVHHVVDAKIREHPDYPTINQAFWDKVTSMIQQRCDGTFLWAGLVLNEILSKDNQTEMDQILKEMPGGLDAIYARILSKIPSRWRQDVARLLHWVAAAAVPLSVSHVAEAWYPECEDRNAEFQKVRDLVSMSGSLLRTDEWDWAERISLIHSSVGDYLILPTGGYDDNHAPKEFRREAHAVHYEMAEVCLRSISSLVPVESRRTIKKPGIHVTQLDGMILEQHNFNYQWISYAVYYWPEHARACAEAAGGLLNLDLPFFRDRSTVRDEWLYLFLHPTGKSKDGMKVEKTDFDLLKVLSFLGLTKMIPALLLRLRHHDKDCINRVGEADCSALCQAAAAGHEDTVLVLLAEGARVTECYPGQACALQAAFVAQRFQIARILLQHVCKNAANSHLPVHEKLSATLLQKLLFHASAGDDVRFLKLLYDNFMGINPLKREVVIDAVRYASPPVLEFLLNQGFDIGPKDEETGLPCLHLAVARSDSNAVGIVEALLKHGAHVNERSYTGLSALHLAVLNRTKAIPNLLAHGADVNATVCDRLPIHMALRRINFEAAELLLDASKGTGDTQANHQKSFAILSHCIAFDFMKRMEFGLSYHIEINLNDTALQKRLCEKLLRKGADINFEEQEAGGLTILDQFCEPLWACQLDYVQILMQHGAHCKLVENTERLQALLAERSRDGLSAHDWDGKMCGLLYDALQARKNAA